MATCLPPRTQWPLDPAGELVEWKLLSLATALLGTHAQSPSPLAEAAQQVLFLGLQLTSASTLLPTQGP